MTDKIDEKTSEFWIQYAQLNNIEIWDLFRKCGWKIFDDGKIKVIKAMFKASILALANAMNDGFITLDEMVEYLENLRTNKLTRYALEVELAKKEREAKQG